MKPEVHKLRVNVKSLAAEAKIIRDEIRRARTPEAKAALHSHRMFRVRPESRMAHLALAFVRGVPYKTAEANARAKPDAKELANKTVRFAPRRDAINEVAEWLRA